MLKELDLHLNNTCSLRCRHCVFSSGERKIREMSFDVIKKTIREFVEINNNGVINLFGGEPLLRSDILYIIKEIKKQGLSVGITTNCEVSNYLIKKVLAIGIDRITTNLDGATAQTHDWIRNQKGNFEKAKRALKLFVSKKLFTTVNSVIHKDNIHEAISILNICRDLKVNALAFYFLTPTGRGLDLMDKVVGPNQWLGTKKIITKWITNNNPELKISWEQAYETSNDNKLPWKCEKNHTDTLFIRCDGEAYSCALLEGSPCSLGNINQKTIKEILKNKTKKCFSRKRGCPAISFHVNKDVYGKDPRASTNLIKLGCPYEYRVLN